MYCEGYKMHFHPTLVGFYCLGGKKKNAFASDLQLQYCNVITPTDTLNPQEH